MSRPASPAGQSDSHALTELTVPPTQAAAATTMPLVNAAPPPATQSRIVLSATADAWMEVRDRSGQILLNRVLHPGESWPVPAQPNLLLTLGNAGGTDILVDGVAVPSMGVSGAVRHDIPLDPDLLKAGKVPSAGLPMTTASSDPSAVLPAASPAVPSAAPQGPIPGAPRFGRQ
jgi:cytoskeleton protein RodZ